MASTTTTSEKVVGVWYDETPEPEYRAWVVADEVMLSDGTTDSTNTVRSFGDDRDAAIQFGTERAAKRGVRLVVQDAARTWGN